MFLEPIPSIKTPNPSLLYSVTTGDPGDCGYFPLGAVRWLTPPRDIAAMVTQTGTKRFTAELFHFGQQRRPMQAELYLLSPGRYTFEVVENGSHPAGDPTSFSVTGPKTRISFDLPPKRSCVLRILPKTEPEQWPFDDTLRRGRYGEQLPREEARGSRTPPSVTAPSRPCSCPSGRGHEGFLAPRSGIRT